MAKKIVFATARIILGIPTLKVIYNDFHYSTPTYHILKTGIIINEIYTKRLFTVTEMHSCSRYNIKKNLLTFKPWSRKVKKIVMWAT
jgi:hypothetical protein